MLNGFKITAVEDNEPSSKTLIFLHGLLGQGRNWRSFALNDMVLKMIYNFEDFREKKCIFGRLT